mgnify:CR=1 FL=1
MNHRMTIAQICGAVESPLFDRKSARIDAKTLAIHLIAFANADGGMIAVRVEDDGTITAMRSISTSCFVRRLTSASPPCGWKRNGSPA